VSDRLSFYFKTMKIIFGITLLSAFSACSFGQNIVNSLNPLGDAVSTGPSFTGTAGWFYNDVVAPAVVGISTAIPRNGNGSMLYNFSGTGTAKGDILYFPNSVVGSLANLTAWSYDSYRSTAGSDAGNTFHPSARVVLSATGALTFNQLVFDSTATVSDTWVKNDIVGTNGRMWASRAFTIGATNYGGNTGSNIGSQSNPQPLSFWQNLLPNASITGLNIGAGSGVVGNWRGASDTLTWGFGGNAPVSHNFEAVPEPATMAAVAFGLAGFAKRRKKS
jgi:hypothetical protein